MKLNGRFIYQGCEKRNGVKDPTKVYFETALLSGVEQLRCSCDKALFEQVLPGIKAFSECDCTFILNPTYNTLRLTDIHMVK